VAQIAATPDKHATRHSNAVGGKYHFLLRRLHSLSGIIPVGVFVIFHLFTNAQLTIGDFQHEVEFIHALPALLMIEIVLWLSIGFHAGLGIVYTVKGAKWGGERYEGNWRYILQRVTGILALVFIFFHIATLRWRWEMFGLFTPFYVTGPEGEPMAAATTAMALQAGWWIVALYIIGVLSVVYHWSNGLWTAAITWGLTLSRKAQQRWGMVCLGLGVALTIFSALAIGGALNYELDETEQAAYERMLEQGATPGHAH